jgi:hypothetical protein
MRYSSLSDWGFWRSGCCCSRGATGLAMAERPVEAARRRESFMFGMMFVYVG